MKVKYKVLDIREFRNEGSCIYHAILQNLNTNKRVSLEIEEDGFIYFDNEYFDNCYCYDLLVKGDMINIVTRDKDIIIEIFIGL